jgi:hypothetical protein
LTRKLSVSCAFFFVRRFGSDPQKAQVVAAGLSQHEVNPEHAMPWPGYSSTR